MIPTLILKNTENGGAIKIIFSSFVYVSNKKTAYVHNLIQFFIEKRVLLISFSSQKV